MTPDIQQTIQDLVTAFRRNLDDYKHSYNEAMVRNEFINPFFEVLGWDTTNRAGYAEAYKDVIHEDAIKIGGVTKAPDYAFRIGGTKKFFVEAKKPSIDIKNDIHPAYQLRRYAWSAKLPLSILTDFEEFAVYDCRIKPAQTDKASTARIMYITYEDFPARWNEIADIFSKEAVLKGSFDRYVESAKRKRGTAEVDRAFLQEIETWRELLARNIALRNSELSQRELNFAVARTVDRIIFLRICEDRGMEEYGQLMTLLNGANVYKRLTTFYQRADEKYNSGLFHFRSEKGRAEQPDELTLRLTIDDNPLKEIFKKLYYPESPYEFSVLPSDILGHIYEQFLGKVIRLTPGHRAKIEEKPEVRKAGGVYYTPTYIVDYIVKNTVGKLVDSKNPKQVTKLKILDPACGSGSFLIGAYQYLLDWHRDWYTQNDPHKWAKGKVPAIYQIDADNWRLTTAKRKEILLNNIYGVDIDPQAVEVTKLSLLLKVLEGESNDTINRQIKLFHERALPDLANNIKCGNSLIGPDFYNSQQISLLDEEEHYRINVFDWKAEFPEVFHDKDTKRNGFDAVIGNPPYGMVTNLESKQYFQREFDSTEGRFDNYELFIEKGVKLCKIDSLLGYIVPSPLLSNLYARKLRSWVLSNCSINEITNFGLNVFSDPTIHTCIIILKNSNNPKHIVLVRKQINEVNELESSFDYTIPQEELGNNEKATFDIFIDPYIGRLFEKIALKSLPLGELCFIRQCIKTGNDKQYVRSFQTYPGDPWKSTLRGRSIQRYATLDNSLYLKYGPHLARNWKNRTFYETPKIAIRETGKRIVSTLDLENRYILSSLYSVYPKSSNEYHVLGYLLGLINSRLATYFIKIIALDITKGAFTKFRTNQLSRLPIRIIDFTDFTDKNRHDKMTQLVERILGLNKQLANAKAPHDQEVFQRQIDATDRQIDQLVYELYDLTDEEIGIVEGK